MFFSTYIAVLGLAAIGQSHMIMNTPVPFKSNTLDNFPLEADGSNFPCKQGPGVYDHEGGGTQIALGSDQPLSFTGSAVHGGGSCQISITYDKAPTKSSVWKVIHSIHGGCPMRDIAGNNGNSASQLSPSQYSFKVPNDLPTGEAVLAWTWFNKVGNREMYMNCAPITITGGASKRSNFEELSGLNATQLLERDTASYNSLPDMFVANIPVEKCKVKENMRLIFPNPGQSVEVNDGGPNAEDTTELFGEDGKTPCPGAGSAAGGGSPPVVSSPAQTSAAPSKPSLPGGIFVTVPAPGQDTQPTAPASPPAPVSPPVSSAPAEAPSQPPAQAPPAAPVVAPTKPVSAAPPAGTETTGSGSALSGPCSTEGEWNCIGGSSFQQCGSGTWSVVQQLAAGTECKSGQTTNSFAISAIGQNRRAIRFSNEHIRRHLRRSS